MDADTENRKSNNPSLRRLPWMGPLVTVIVLSFFHAYRIAFLDGIICFFLGAAAIAAIYGIFKLSATNAGKNGGVVIWRVGIWIVPIGLLLIYPAFSGTLRRDYLMRLECSSNLQRISLALGQYHEQYGCGVPRIVADKNGRPLLSWRVLLLPFLGQADLFRQLRLDESWNSPHNSRILSNPANETAIYRCQASEWHSADLTEASYLMFPEDQPCFIANDRGKSGTTVLIAEVQDSGIHWAEPRDFPKESTDSHTHNTKRMAIGSYHYGGWAGVLLGNNEVDYVLPEQVRREAKGRDEERSGASGKGVSKLELGDEWRSWCLGTSSEETRLRLGDRCVRNRW